MLNPKIGRWVLSSLAQTLSPVANSLGLTFFVEGVDRERKDWFRKDSLVLRVIGPTPVIGSGTVRYRFEVMVMLTDLEKDSENGYIVNDRLGTLMSAMNPPIAVKDEDDKEVGCLAPDRSATTPLRIVTFGKIDSHSEVTQGAVIAHYEIVQ